MQAYIKTTVDTSDEIAKFSSTSFPTLEAMKEDMNKSISDFKEETSEDPISVQQTFNSWSISYHAGYHEYYKVVNI